MCFGHQASTSTPKESPGSKIGLPGPPAALRPRANSQGTWVGLDPIAPGCRRSCFQFLPLACNRGWSGTHGLHLYIVTGCMKPGLGFIFVVFCHVSKLLHSLCVEGPRMALGAFLPAACLLFLRRALSPNLEVTDMASQ